MRALYVILAFSCCTPGPASEGEAVEAMPDAATVDAMTLVDTTVLSTNGSDTLYLVTDEQNSLVWTRGEVGREWRLDSLLAAVPVGRLLRVDQDSTSDLFFTIQWEEFVLGELWLGDPGGERRVFSSSDDACRPPELTDVNEDGRLDVIDWRAGALRPEECSGDVWAYVCQSAYPTEWPEVWIQDETGAFARDSLSAAAFYQEQAAAFLRAVTRLRADLLGRSGPPTDSPRCNASLAGAMERLAERAQSIARIGQAGQRE